MCKVKGILRKIDNNNLLQTSRVPGAFDSNSIQSTRANQGNDYKISRVNLVSTRIINLLYSGFKSSKAFHKSPLNLFFIDLSDSVGYFSRALLVSLIVREKNGENRLVAVILQNSECGLVNRLREKVFEQVSRVQPLVALFHGLRVYQATSDRGKLGCGKGAVLVLGRKIRTLLLFFVCFVTTPIIRQAILSENSCGY